jgi:hypothetical protein
LNACSEKDDSSRQITRADIDDYKTARSTDESQQHKGRIITPRTINFEVSVLRTFFYFLMRMENPCARFKSLKDPKTKARRKPPTYKQPELDRIFKHCDQTEKTIFATLRLTGLREQELYFLDWPDVDLKAGTIRVTPKPTEGFSPKDYEERAIPIPPDLLNLLKELPQKNQVLFPSKKGKRLTHLLRTLKEIAASAKIPHATPECLFCARPSPFSLLAVLEAPVVSSLPAKLGHLFLCEGEAAGGLAFEGFVRVQILSCGFDVAVAHQFLHRDNVAATFKKPCRVGVATISAPE